MKALSLAAPVLALAALVAPPLAEAGHRHGPRCGHGPRYSYGRGYGSASVHRHGPGCGHYGYLYRRPAPYLYGGYYGGGYGGYYGYYGDPYGYYPPPPPPRYAPRRRGGVGIYFRF